MNYITFTQLRTRSNELIKLLQQGQSVSLIYRSRIVGEILPKEKPSLVQPGDDFTDFLKKTASKVSYKENERKKIYLRHLKRRYGKRLS